MVECFEKISEDVVYKGKYRRVVEKRFQLPDGETNDYEVLTQANDYGGAVIILAINDKNEVLVNYEFRAGTEKVMIDLPSGGLEKGEDLKHAAIRELVEETGHMTKAEDLEFLGSTVGDPYSEIKHHFFLTRKVEKIGGQKLDSTEFIEFGWIPLSKFVEKARNGEVCSMYAMAFLMALDKIIDNNKGEI
ncbi:MAG: NUDIX hydrolase [Candidatus Nomurabacteria bacterium]|jgi:ADP-ribose pyrophosphatase|nr:NUDIX hydrolase [Candidatus Nomurabacteria bacterium]